MRAKTGLRVSAAALSAGIALIASLPAYASSPAGPTRALAGQVDEANAVTAASGGIALPLKGFGSIVADPAHGHLFMSQGPTATGILVTTLAGKVVTTINQEAAGMTLSPDGTTLYAADPGSGNVLAIDTTTLGVTAQYAIGSDPVSVAFEDDKVWVGYASAIGDIDLSVNPAVFTPQPTMSSGWTGAPQVAADPSGGGALVAASAGSSPGFAASFDVSTATPTVRVPVTAVGSCDNERDLAVAPGGSEFVLACGYPYNHYRFSTGDLSQLGDYPSDSYPNAVAIAQDGTVAAGIQGWYSPDVYVYHQNTTTALNKYEFGGPTWNLVPKGLAWGGKTRLYAVIQDLNTSAYALRVLPNPELIPAALAVTASAGTLNYGGRVTVTAHLGKTSTNRTVSIYAQTFGTTGARLLQTGRVNSKGTLSVSYTATRSTAFSVTFGGDTKYAPRTVKRNVYVHAKVIMANSGWYRSTHIRGTLYRVYHHTAHLNVTVTVAPNKHGECVVLEGQQYDPSSGTWSNDQTFGCGKLRANSKASGYLILTGATGGQYRLRADYTRSSADHVNINTDSSWFYFTVVK